MSYESLRRQPRLSRPVVEYEPLTLQRIVAVNDVMKRQKRPVLNILLMGETGAGKSTWINGFANYLKFQSLDEALHSEELTPIPCTFTMMNNNHDEYEVCTGLDENECYVLRGESCTQLPKTYVFSGSNLTVRMIDTPGIGDTRGIDQDKINMQFILDHIATFPQIHGICILLRANNPRLTVQFRYCINELLTQLHREASHNVVFCFTSCRGCQYGPGDTFPALRELLKDNKDINLKPYFCIDNEAIRYLYAVKNARCFKPEESLAKANNESWNKAMNEIERLITHITNLKPHDVRDTLSLNDARRSIFKLAKPLEQLNKDIDENIRAIAKEEKRMDEEHLMTGYLLSELTTPVIRQVTIPLDIPLLVCTKCVEEVQSYHITTTQYKCSRIANENTGFWRKQVRKSSRSCATCKCSWAFHEKIRHKTQKIEEFIVNSGVRDKISDKNTLLKEIDAHKKLLQTRVKEYKDEKKEIQLARRKFAFFLKKNAITPINENLLDYLEFFIRTDLYSSETKLAEVEDIRERHKRIHSILDKAIGDNFADVAPLSARDVRKLIDDLCKLKHFGEQLRQLLKVIEEADNNALDDYVVFVDIQSRRANSMLNSISKLIK